MNQTKLGSLIEAIAGTIVGFAVSMALAPIVYPMFGHTFTAAQNLGITAIFTVVSVVRGYVLRRGFNAWLRRASMAAARRLTGGAS